jgi:hypothetical protein
VRAIFNTPVWLQAGQYLALAAQIPAIEKKRLSAPSGSGHAEDNIRHGFFHGGCEAFIAHRIC